jgi:hypothetical protein
MICEMRVTPKDNSAERKVSEQQSENAGAENDEFKHGDGPLHVFNEGVLCDDSDTKKEQQ